MEKGRKIKDTPLFSKVDPHNSSPIAKVYDIGCADTLKIMELGSLHLSITPSASLQSPSFLRWCRLRRVLLDPTTGGHGAAVSESEWSSSALSTGLVAERWAGGVGRGGDIRRIDFQVLT